jgi:phosphodiester glycosidase
MSRMRAPRRLRSVVTTLVLAALLTLPGPTSGAVTGNDTAISSVQTMQLTPSGSIVLKRIVGQTVDGTIRAWVIQMDPGAEGTFDVATPKTSFPGKATVSAMGISHHATAAINGDFGNDRVLHALLQDGSLWQTGIQTHGNFAVSRDETHAWVGRPHTHVRVLNGTASTSLFAVDRWNSGKPGTGQIAGYSPQGGSMENPPGSACSARLVNPSSLSWAPGKSGLQRTYSVDVKKCAPGAMSENGAVVISTKDAAGAARTAVTSLKAGQKVTVRWSFAWPGIMDTIGGRPLLLENGANVAPAACRICGRNPRAAVAVNQACTTGGTGCRVSFIVVDGRQGAWSSGMTLLQLATFVQKSQVAGAYSALNLDGGGSAEVWINKQPSFCWKKTSVGCVLNHPTADGTHLAERPVESALLALAGADTKPKLEPTPSGP